MERWLRPCSSRLLSHLPGGPTCTAILTGIASFSVSSLQTWCLWIPGTQVVQDDGFIAGTFFPATQGLRQPNWCLWGWRCPITHPGTRHSLEDSALQRRCFLTEPHGLCSATDLLGDQGKPPTSRRPSFLVCQVGTLAVTLCVYIH